MTPNGADVLSRTRTRLGSSLRVIGRSADVAWTKVPVACTCLSSAFPFSEATTVTCRLDS